MMGQQQWSAFYRQLGECWGHLADVLGIPPGDQRRFPGGDEGRAIVHWLSYRSRLDELPAALESVGRSDLVPLVSRVTQSDDPDAVNGASTLSTGAGDAERKPSLPTSGVATTANRRANSAPARSPADARSPTLEHPAPAGGDERTVTDHSVNVNPTVTSGSHIGSIEVKNENHNNRWWPIVPVAIVAIVAIVGIVAPTVSHTEGRPPSAMTTPSTTAASSTTATTTAVSPSTSGEALTTPPGPGGTIHQIRSLSENVDTGCLDGPSSAPDGRVQITPCANAPTMDWQLTNTGQITDRGGENCLALADSANPDGGHPVRTSRCSANEVEQFWSRDGDVILNQNGGCLDIDIVDGDRREVQVWPCDDTPEQLWQLR